MVSNGVSRGRPGRTPQFLTLGLLVVICILAFNYWNVSSRSRLLQRQVQEMTGTLEELAMKKVHLEKRGEALQSQIGDANKVNVNLKAERETCIQEQEEVRKGKEDLVAQLRVLAKEKETAVSSLEQFRTNASKTIQMLMEMKAKYESLHLEHQQIQEASRIDGVKKDQTIREMQQEQREVFAQCEKLRLEQDRVIADLRNKVLQLQEANSKCSAAMQVPGGEQQEAAQNAIQVNTNNQNRFAQMQAQFQRQQQPQQQQQQVVPQNAVDASQLWQQRQQEYIRNQQQQQQQQLPQQPQQGHLLYGQDYNQQNNQLAKEEQRQQGLNQEGKPVNQDPGPVQMEENAENKPEGGDQQQQMFPEREQQAEEKGEGEAQGEGQGEGQEVQGEGQEEVQGEGQEVNPDQQEVDGNQLDQEEQNPDQVQREGDAEEEEEESELSDVDNKDEGNEEEQDPDQGQVQAPNQGDEGDEESSLSEVGKVENDNDEREEIILQEEELPAHRLEDEDVEEVPQDGEQSRDDPNQAQAPEGQVDMVDGGNQIGQEQDLEKENQPIGLQRVPGPVRDDRIPNRQPF